MKKKKLKKKHIEGYYINKMHKTFRIICLSCLSLVLVISVISYLVLEYDEEQNNECPDNCIKSDCFTDYGKKDCLCFIDNIKYCLDEINIQNDVYFKFKNYVLSILITYFTIIILNSQSFLILNSIIIGIFKGCFLFIKSFCFDIEENEEESDENKNDSSNLSTDIIIILSNFSTILIIIYTFFHYVFDASDLKYYEKCDSNCFLNECDNKECKCFDINSEEFTCDYSYEEKNEVYEQYYIFYKINLITVSIIVSFFGFFLLITQCFRLLYTHFTKLENTMNENNAI